MIKDIELLLNQFIAKLKKGGLNIIYSKHHLGFVEFKVKEFGKNYATNETEIFRLYLEGQITFNFNKERLSDVDNIVYSYKIESIETRKQINVLIHEKFYVLCSKLISISSSQSIN